MIGHLMWVLIRLKLVRFLSNHVALIPILVAQRICVVRWWCWLLLRLLLLLLLRWLLLL